MYTTRTDETREACRCRMTLTYTCCEDCGWAYTCPVHLSHAKECAVPDNDDADLTDPYLLGY